jgi:hypothetical protein
MNMQHEHGMQHGHMDMDMQHGHGHTAWTWTRSTDLVMRHGPGQWTCTDAWMPECRNADKKLSPASLVFS